MSCDCSCILRIGSLLALGSLIALCAHDANGAVELSDNHEPFKILIDAPSRVAPHKTFKLRVSYSVMPDPKGQPGEKRIMHISADRSADVVYNPYEFDLMPNGFTFIDVTVNPTVSGLAEILLASSHYHNVHLSVNTGFRGHVKWRANQSLESGTSHYDTINFVDDLDRPLSLDAPITLRLVGGNAKIRKFGGSAWSDHIDLPIPIGASDAGLLEIEPTTLVARHGSLEARGFLNDENEVLFDQLFTFEIEPPVWVRLGMTIAGALLYTLYALSRTLSGRVVMEVAKAIVSGVFAGVLAWAFADWNVLGIRIDTSRLTGYFILGLITSYAGVEPLLARFAVRNEIRRAGHDRIADVRDSVSPTE
jgi:hypothetical protein